MNENEDDDLSEKFYSVIKMSLCDFSKLICASASSVVKTRTVDTASLSFYKD